MSLLFGNEGMTQMAPNHRFEADAVIGQHFALAAVARAAQPGR